MKVNNLRVRNFAVLTSSSGYPDGWLRAENLYTEVNYLW